MMVHGRFARFGRAGPGLRRTDWRRIFIRFCGRKSVRKFPRTSCSVCCRISGPGESAPNGPTTTTSSASSRLLSCRATKMTGRTCRMMANRRPTASIRSICSGCASSSPAIAPIHPTRLTSAFRLGNFLSFSTNLKSPICNKVGRRN